MAATGSQSTTTTLAPTDAELLQAQADLWRHSLYYLTSMALKCAVELHIPTAIHNLGGAASEPDLVTALSLPPAKLPFLCRIMRLLVTSGVFASGSGRSGGAGGGEAETYRLNALSWLLVEGVDAEDHTYQKYFVLGTNSRHYVEAALSLAEWFKKDLEHPVPSPFEVRHGARLLDESTAQLDEELDMLVNEGVAAHDKLAVGTIIRQCHELFEGVRSLTEVRGGDGTVVRAIMKAYPGIKCTVLDTPKAIQAAPVHDGVTYVAGDMFKFVPPAQAVFLKVVLHLFSDEECVEILKQCRKAIPSREEGGKVIIVEIVLSPDMSPVMYEAQLLMDMLMLVNIRGRQRDENDYRDIFTKAGFSDYKILKKIGARGIIEVYP